MIPPRIEKILELARWAPSGDNTQPWRFEILDRSRFVIHGHDTRDWCVYDLDGRATQIAIGALMENVAIAASALGLRAEFDRRPEAAETHPTIDVTLVEDSAGARDSLVEFIEHRVTQRRALATTRLTPVQQKRLERSVGPDHSVAWIEGSGGRWRIARLMSRNAKIRLTIPEAYEVHVRAIEWDARTSHDRIPDRAVGLDPVGLRLMRWAMHSWKRVDFLNRYLAGTWLPRLQLDLIPGWFCGAHFLISAHRELSGIDAFLDGGRAMQRFWLTAAQQGLQLQPAMTPLIFARYVAGGLEFTGDPGALAGAAQLAFGLEQTFGPQAVARGVFMGRIGAGSQPAARSTRFATEELLLRDRPPA